MNEYLLLAIAGLLTLLWYFGRSQKAVGVATAPAKVFCLHCNWQGRVLLTERRCGSCGSQHLSVLSV